MNSINKVKYSQLYSVRMRAAQGGAHEKGGKHISGGECLSTYSNLKNAVNHLLEKGLSHSRGQPDFMQIQFDLIEKPIKFISPLPVTTQHVSTLEQGQAYAKKMLNNAGVPIDIIDKSYHLLSQYSDLRGALLIDIHTGNLVKCNKKVVRVSRLDWNEINFNKWANHYQIPLNMRLKEALTLASKVNQHPLTVAELCWSDDPDYVTGYVASKQLGYIRIDKMKKYGDQRGCRIFYVNGQGNMKDYIDYLENQPVFVHWEEET